MTVSNPTSPFARTFIDDLIARAAAVRQRIVLPEGDDPRILAAAARVVERGVCDLTILGNREEITGILDGQAIALDLDAIDLVDLAADTFGSLRTELAEGYARARAHRGVTVADAYAQLRDASTAGTMMVHLGHADGLVSGAAHTTAETIRPALQIIRTRPEASLVSSVFIMLLADRALVFGDCAVNPAPTPDQLAEIAAVSADTARRFRVDPRVAMLSYSTGTSGSGPAVDAVREATRALRERQPDLLVDGPIQYDAAVNPTVARAKLPGSPIAGRATVLVFPDLQSGNIAYKAVQQSAGAVAVGPILQGLNKPVNDLSRGCTVTDILTTVAVTAVQAQP